jgi:Ca2+-binding EF-hand superfamily protein
VHAADAGDVGVMHVVCCMVEHVAESSADVAQAWGGEEPLDAIAAFLSNATKSTRAVPRPKYTTDKMTMLKPVPGRARVDMPAVAELTEGERQAFATSLYHFMPTLNPFQVERALLREETRRMLVEFEVQAGSVSAEELTSVWDDELSTRSYWLELGPAEMATRFQEAVAAMGPDQTLLKSYYGRHDQVLIAVHTPMPAQPRCMSRKDVRGVPGISNLAEWDAGKRPELAYAVNASKTSVLADQQSSYLFDSGSVVVRSTGSKLETKAYMSGHVFGTTSGSKTFTASLADGCTVCIKTDDFKSENGGVFMTVTLTNPDGKSVVLNGNGSVSASRKRGTTKYQTDFDRSCAGLSLPDEHNVSVVSKGSVVKHYPDGRIGIAYYTGDTSEYDPNEKSWFDMNESGVRQRRHDGVKYDQYKRPEPAGAIPSRKYVDHETNDDVSSREDRVQRNKSSDGTSFVKHADGTEMDVGKGFVGVNLPDYSLRVKVASSDTDVTLEDGGTMQLVWPVLSHFQTGPVEPMHGPGSLAPTKVQHSWNTLDSKSRIVVTRPDGTVITVRDGIVSVVPGFPSGSNYVFNINAHRRRPLVEAVDGLNNSITVLHDGDVTCTVAEAPSGYKSLHTPHLFIVNPDGSGTEWLKQDETEHMLATWEQQQVLMRGPAPREPTSTTFTVSGLDQSDVHRPPLVQGRPQKVTHHPPLTEAERVAFTSGVEDFAAWTGAEQAAADALIVRETRPQEQIDAEAAVQARAAEEEADLTMQADMIAKYLSTPIDQEVIASADEYFRKFDLNSDGILTADEMREQLLEWGITQPLEDYIATDTAGEILADKIVTKGEWYSFYFPVIECLPDNGTQLTADRIAQQKAAIARYAASADMVASADEYYAQFDLDHDGKLTAGEVREKLQSWGISTKLEDYVVTDGESHADDRVITIGEWYEFYFPVVEQLRPADDPLPLLDAPAAPVTVEAMPEEKIIQQHFLVHPRTIDFGTVIQGCMYRQPLSMTNVGGENPSRYKVRQPANQAVRLVHGASTVPRGETAMLEVEFNASLPGKCQEPVEIVCGDQVFRLSVTADVKLPPKIDFHPYGTGRRLERKPAGGAGKKATDLRQQVAAA